MPDMAVRAKEMFFFGMLNGYAFGKTGNRPIHYEIIREGWKENWNEDGNWKILDRWNSNGGNTQIWDGSTLVWVMRYRGTYPKEVIPVVKASLAHCYEMGRFCGGRGPTKFTVSGESVWYENAWTGDFKNFRGTEKIVRLKKLKQPEAWGLTEEVGTHEYCGMMMID